MSPARPRARNLQLKVEIEVNFRSRFLMLASVAALAGALDDEDALGIRRWYATIEPRSGAVVGG